MSQEEKTYKQLAWDELMSAKDMTVDLFNKIKNGEIDLNKAKEMNYANRTHSYEVRDMANLAPMMD